jgi:dTDP-4-amino-4,6-dideoxygalactose transaminase
MKKIGWWNTSLGEKELHNITNAFSNRKIGMGSETKALEEDICNLLDVPYCVVFPSGSVALYVALMVIGIKAGDEVIIPNRTFIATAHAIVLAGATVKLVDSNKDNTNIDTSKILEAISPKTKAIIPVHLNGCSTNMKEINEIAKQHNLTVIEDASQSLLSKNKNGQYLGTLSKIGCFSLGLAKLISMGYGGFSICRDKNLYDKMIKFRDHGSSELYAHESFGFNFKVSDLLSSMCRVQVARGSEKVKHVIDIYKLYKEEIYNLKFMEIIKVDVENGEVPLYVEVRSEYRDQIMQHLQTYGIQTQKLQASLNTHEHLQNKGSFPHSDIFDKELFRLPCGPDQPLENIHYVIDKLKIFKEKK